MEEDIGGLEMIRQMTLIALVLSLALIGCVGGGPVKNNTAPNQTQQNVTPPQEHPQAPSTEEMENAAISEIEKEMEKTLENVTDEEIEQQLSEVL